MKSTMLCLCVLILTGCAAFQRPDGSIDPEKVESAGAATGTAVSTIIPPPLGLAIGGVATAVASAFAAYLRGKERGWDDKDADLNRSTVSPKS